MCCNRALGLLTATGLFALAILPVAGQPDGSAPAPADVSTAEAEASAEAEPIRTRVESEKLLMRALKDRNHFFFSGAVHVEGTNLEVYCDELEVVAFREGEDPEAAVGQLGAIESIEARGNVRVLQAGREARAGRAVVVPGAGKVVLSENPVIIDGGTEVSGFRIILEKGARTPFVVEQRPGGGQRPTVRLEPLPDLGYDLQEELEGGAEAESDSGNPSPQSSETDSPGAAAGGGVDAADEAGGREPRSAEARENES